MADVSYESLQSQIQEQKGKITTKREFIKQERVVGERSIESLRRVDPRTPPGVYFGQVEPRMESIKGRLVELESAEKELTIAEQELTEQEKLLASKKAEGWKIRGKDSGYEFYKETQVPSDAGRPRGEFSIIVRWRTAQGDEKTFQTTNVHLSKHLETIESRGGQVIEVESLGGGREFRTPEMRTTTGGGFILWEAKPEVVKPVSEPLKILLARPSIPSIEQLTFLKKTIPEKHPELQYLLKYAEPTQAKELRTAILSGKEQQIKVASETAFASLTSSEKVSYAKKYYKFGEEEKTWSEIQKEQPFWELAAKDSKFVIETPETSERLLLKWHRAKYKDVDPITGFIGKYASALVHGTFDPEFWIRLARGGPESARVIVARGERRVDPLIKEGKWGEYAWSVVTSPGYTHVVLPFAAGAGLGVAFKGIGLAAKAATGTAAKVLTTFATKVPYVYGGVVSAMVGADIGYTAALEEKGLVRPDTTIAKISRYGVQFGFAIAGARWVAAPRKPILKKEILYRYDPQKELIAVAQRKYVDFLGKPRYYGKPVVGVKPETLFVKTFDPYLAYARVSKYGVMGVTPTVVGEPPSPYGVVVRPLGALVPTRMPAVSIISPPGIKPLWRIPLEPRARIELEAERKLRELWDEKKQRQYEETMKRVGEKLGITFKPPKPRVDVLKVKELDAKLGYAIVEKYGVIGITPTVVGKPPVPAALMIRPVAALIPTEFPIRIYKLAPEVKPLWRIPLEPRARIELEAERELRRLWDEKKQRQYEETMKRVGEKLGITFKPPKPRVDVLRIKELDAKLGYAIVEKYGVIGITPTVVGKPPVPGIGIYTGRQPILRPISALTIWDWLTRQPVKPPIEKEPLFKISPILMKPIKYTLKDIIKEPKLKPGETITKDGQILIQKIIKETKPPIVKKKLIKPKKVYDPYEVYEETEFVRNEMVESFNRLIGKPTVKPVGPTVIQRDILLMFPTLKAEPMVKERVTPVTVADIDRDIRQMQLRFPVTKLDRGLLFDTLQTQYQTQIQFQTQMQKPMQKLTSATIQEQIQFQAQMLDIKPMRKFIQEQITITERKPKPPVFVLPDTPYEMFGHTMGQGYNVKIKERHIVKGKKIKEPRFLRINKRPLSLRDAEALRGMVLDNSAAASGKIVPVNAMAQEPLIDLKPFEDIEHKFYMKDDILIEKRKYRIDTKGEVKGISALGWYAERTKKAAKKREVVARRPRERIVKERDMFDIGMDDMLVNMDKIFKGVMGFGF